MLRVTTACIRNWIRDYRIPHFKLNEMYVDARDFRARIPFFDPDQQE